MQFDKGQRAWPSALVLFAGLLWLGIGQTAQDPQGVDQADGRPGPVPRVGRLPAGRVEALVQAGGQPPVREGPPPLAATLGPKVTVLEYDHGDVSPWLEFFTFDSRRHPKLLQLRRRYALGEKVKDCRSDLQRALVLKRWVCGALKFGTPTDDVFEDWSAVALLERAQEGQVVWCGQAAMVFQQACWALGIPSRYIECGRPENPACHFTTEVFLEEFGKWAVIDATPLDDFNVYYTVDGVPQTALEMHHHVVSGTMDRVVEVHPERSHPVKSKTSPAWAFYYVRWLTRCDVVTHTPQFHDLEHTFDRRWHTVDWIDEKTVPWEESQHAAWFVRKQRLTAWRTSDSEVVSWKPTDRVRILLCPGPQRRIFGHLWTGDREFDHYQVRLDDGPWKDMPKGNTRARSGKTFGWGLRRFSIVAAAGPHCVEVRVVRGDASVGPASYVRLKIEPEASPADAARIQ
jgi:hypothetical protein